MNYLIERRRAVAAFVFAIVVCVGARFVAAQPPPLLSLDPWNGTAMAHTWDEPLTENKTHLRTDGSSYHLFWYDSYGRFRLNRSSQSPTFAYRALFVDLGSHTKLLPSQLTDQHLEMGVHLGQVAGWDLGVNAGVGYDGNSPFDQTDAIYGVGDIVLTRPITGNDSLRLSLDYSGFNAFIPDAPLPGFAWIHRTRDFDFTVGYPSDSVLWRPFRHAVLSMRYVVPFDGQAEASYTLLHGVSVYGLFRNYFEGFHVRGYAHTQRLFMNMDRAEVGIRFVHTDVIDLSVGVGYAFNQQFSRGFDVRSLRPQAQVANAPYVAFLLRGEF